MGLTIHDGQIVERSAVPVRHQVEFAGKAITVIERDCKYYVAMKRLCENMGVDWRSQHKVIRRDPVLSQVVVMMTMTSVGRDGKSYKTEMVCLPLEYLNGWLFKIEVSRYQGIKRQELISYQKECHVVLYRHFFHTDSRDGMMTVSKDEMIRLLEELSSLLRQINELQAEKIATLQPEKTPEPQFRTGRLSAEEKRSILEMHRAGLGPAEIGRKIRRKSGTVGSFLRRERCSNEEKGNAGGKG